MSASQDRLIYMKEQGLSDITIEGMTGIPRSTIGFVRRGERSIPSEYIRTLYDKYRTVSYNALTAESLPYHQARKYSSRSTKTVNDVSIEMRKLIEISTKGAIIGKLAGNKSKGIIQSNKQVEKDMLAAVKAGYKKSHKSYDDYKDYKFRKEEADREKEEEESQMWGGWFE